MPILTPDNGFGCPILGKNKIKFDFLPAVYFVEAGRKNARRQFEISKTIEILFIDILRPAHLRLPSLPGEVVCRRRRTPRIALRPPRHVAYLAGLISITVGRYRLATEVIT